MEGKSDREAAIYTIEWHFILNGYNPPTDLGDKDDEELLRWAANIRASDAKKKQDEQQTNINR